MPVSLAALSCCTVAVGDFEWVSYLVGFLHAVKQHWRHPLPSSPPFLQVLGDGSKVDMNISFLDLMLRETEKLHAHVRRYTSPDEAAFFPQDLPAPILPALHYPRVLHPNSININGRVKSLYLESILPKISPPGSINSTYGSTTVADIAVLQALSKRIHFGKFIAEAKFQAEPELYQQLIRANDAEGIMRTLTKPAVEERVLQRVEEKVDLPFVCADPQPPPSPPAPLCLSGVCVCVTERRLGQLCCS